MDASDLSLLSKTDAALCGGKSTEDILAQVMTEKRKHVQLMNLRRVLSLAVFTLKLKFTLLKPLGLLKCWMQRHRETILCSDADELVLP